MAKCVDCLNVDSSFHVFHDTDSESFFGDDTEHENSKRDDDERVRRPLVACKYGMSLEVASYFTPLPRKDLLQGTPAVRRPVRDELGVASDHTPRRPRRTDLERGDSGLDKAMDKASDHGDLSRRTPAVRRPVRDELSVASDHIPRRPKRIDLEGGDSGLNRTSDHGKRRVLPQRSRSAKSTVRSPVGGPATRMQSGGGGTADIRALPGRSRSSRQTPSKSISLGPESARWGNMKSCRPETHAEASTGDLYQEEIPRDSEGPTSRSDSGRDLLVDSCDNGGKGKMRPSDRMGRKNSRNFAAYGSGNSLVSLSNYSRKEQLCNKGQRNTNSRSPRLSSRTLREMKVDLENASRSRQNSATQKAEELDAVQATRTQERRSPCRITRTGSSRDVMAGNGDGIQGKDRNRRGVLSSEVPIRECLEMAEIPLRRGSPSRSRHARTSREVEKTSDEDSLKLPRHSNRQKRDMDNIEVGNSNQGAPRSCRGIVAGTRGVARTRSGRRDQRELMRTQYAAAIERYKTYDDEEDEDEEVVLVAETSDTPEPQESAEKGKMENLPDASSSRTSLFAMAALVASNASKAAVLAVKSTTQVVGSKQNPGLP